MTNTVSFIFLFASILSLIAAVLSLVIPQKILAWAHPQKRKRLTGFFFFILWTSVFIINFVFSIVDHVKPWEYAIDGFFILVSLLSIRNMRCPEQKSCARPNNTSGTVDFKSLTSDASYKLQPWIPACSCPDWQDRREGLEAPFAICKHLALYYSQHPENIPDSLVNLKSLIASFARLKRGFPMQGDYYKWGSLKKGAYLATAYDDRLPWVDVYTDAQGPQHYGFNLLELRWSYRNQPPYAEEIAQNLLTPSEHWECAGEVISFEETTSENISEQKVASKQRQTNDRKTDELVGIAKGLVSDGVLNDTEALFLVQWLKENGQLDVWPFDVINRRITAMLADGIIDDTERAELLELLKELVGGKAIADQVASFSSTLPLTSPQPEILFADRTFCLTGKFAFGKKKDCERAVIQAGGECKDYVSKKLDYLVIGLVGSEEWEHSPFGQKIQKALAYNKEGCRIKIIGEDAWAEALRNNRTKK